MSRSAGAFTKSEVAAALKAALDAGMEVERVEIGKNGKIIIYAGKPGEANSEAEKNEWDE
jgi:hypothetical protein